MLVFQENFKCACATGDPVPDTMCVDAAVEGGLGVHLSIRVQSGPHCLLSKIFFPPLHITFDGLLLRVAEQDCRVSKQHVIDKVDKPGMVAWKWMQGVLFHCVKNLVPNM